MASESAEDLLEKVLGGSRDETSGEFRPARRKTQRRREQVNEPFGRVHRDPVLLERFDEIDQDRPEPTGPLRPVCQIVFRPAERQKSLVR
jgi:hypothetical protein